MALKATLSEVFFTLDSMLNTLSFCSGKNEFKDDTFSASEWSAPTMIDPHEIRARFKSLKLEGRKIKQMKLIGLSYFHVRDWIESYAYDVLDQLDEEKRQKQSDYNHIAPDVLFGRNAEIDEPLLIEFEDGDIFEIETLQQSAFRFSMNCIPWWIDAGTNLPNLDANVFFSPCIGRTIKAIEVNTYLADKHPIWNEYFDDEHSQRELVSDVVLRLDDGNGISVGADMTDYCEIALIDKNKQLLMMPFQELKPALFNWEDLHIDQVTGFEPEGSTFFFGKTGADHAEEPFITLVPQNSESRLNIAVEDFLLFDWVITWFTKQSFDEYGQYDFRAKQWKAMLAEAITILDFESFDELFDYLTGVDVTCSSGANVFLSSLNRSGADFWKYKELFKTQLKDMLAWTKLVLSDNGSITIYGFDMGVKK
jgi:hypothetical protein